MNKLLIWLAQKQAPKLTRYLMAALGAWLAKVGFDGDHLNLVALLTGLAMFGASALWSVAHKLPGYDWVEKILGTLDFSDKAAARLWIEALVKKGIAALFVWLSAHGAQLDAQTTTEGALGLLLTFLLSKLNTPDPHPAKVEVPFRK